MQYLEIDCSKDQSVHQLNFKSPKSFKPITQKRQTIDPLMSLFDNQSFKKSQPINKNILKTIIIKQKVNKLTNNFLKKIRRNSIYRTPAQQLDPNKVYKDDGEIINKIKRLFKYIGEQQGIILGNVALAIWSLVNILQITLMVFIFSIMVTFPQTQQFQIFLSFRIFSVILYVIDMILNFVTQRYESGSTLKAFGQIAAYYLKNGFIIDLISILIFPVDLLVQGQVTIFISFLALIKLASNLKKFEKFQYLYITTSEREQYYGLIKVFLMNFTIGHFLAIFLNLMAYIQDQNWTEKMGITNQEWYIKYIWGYYWGTNIMLTVGFGDLSATNQYEAIILIFVQTLSCITLAYNISYVGALISSMKQNQESKKRKMKTFHKMCKQNFICNEIETKITNFIDESYRIKEAFEHDYEEQLMNFLPKSMQLEYRKQSNKILFDNLGFLGNLSKKSLVNLAESITRKICHPQQIIVKKGYSPDFIILRKGQLGFACKNQSSVLDGQVFETLSISAGQISCKPKLFSLDFIKNKQIPFSLKSMAYSDIFFMTREEFMASLKISDMDYQLFCVLKDRQQYILDQNELYKCEVCQNQYHNRFTCPRLHYIPINQMIIARGLKNIKRDHQKRFKYNRNTKYSRTEQYKPLLARLIIEDCQQRFIKEYYDEESFGKIQDLMNFYFKLKLVNNNNKPKKRNISIDVNDTLKSKIQLNAIENSQIYQNTNTENILKSKTQNYSKILIRNREMKFMEDDRTINRLEQLLLADRRDHENTFWDLEIDQAHNFRYYFTKNNPEALSQPNKIKQKTKINLENIFGFI